MPPMIELIGVDRHYLAFRATGKVQAHDVEEMARVIEEKTQHHPTVRVLLQLTDFEGWTLGAEAEVLLKNLRDGKRVEKLAIVGERKSAEPLAWAVEIFGSSIANSRLRLV